MPKAAFGDNAKGKIQTSEWFSRSKRREILVVDCKRSSRLSTGRTDENVEMS